MAKNFEIVCPCCEASLVVDRVSGEVLLHKAKEKRTGGSLESMVAGLDAQNAREMVGVLTGDFSLPFADVIDKKAAACHVQCLRHPHDCALARDAGGETSEPGDPRSGRRRLRRHHPDFDFFEASRRRRRDEAAHPYACARRHHRALRISYARREESVREADRSERNWTWARGQSAQWNGRGRSAERHPAE